MHDASKGNIIDIYHSKQKHRKVVFLRPLKFHAEASNQKIDLRRNFPKFSSKLLIGLLVVGVAGFSFTLLGKPQNNDNGQVLGATASANQEQDNNFGDGNAFVKTAQAASLDDQEQGERKPFEYEVEGGDTLSNIAQKYNLKLETILWANNLTEKSVIKPGQVLTLLPVNGVLHTVQKGNTISEIASVYKADTQKIIEYNGLSDVTKIHAGDMVIVPDGKPLPPPPTPKSSSKVTKGKPGAQVAAGSLLWPTTHRNVSQGYSASHRGLDIANGGKPAIIAAQSGKVEFAGKDGAWGNTIVIRGDDGLVTRYSHNSENYVKTGDPVSAGDTIGKVGNTGNVRGKTGLHVDFRVYKNGVAINPKSVVK